MKRTALFALAVIALFYGPLIVAHLRISPVDPGAATVSDAAIVFGAIVQNGQISPLHRERLTAGRDLFDRGIVPTIVVSNTPHAVKVMRQHLTGHGVPPSAIEIDDQAQKTSDTCKREAATGQGRDVILISQRFHLARLAHHCAKEGVIGQLIAAEAYSTGPSQLPFHRVAWIRLSRHSREAALLWASLLGIYESLTDPIPASSS